MSEYNNRPSRLDKLFDAALHNFFTFQECIIAQILAALNVHDIRDPESSNKK